MPATVICFESFRREQDRQRAGSLVQESGIARHVLSPRQIAHRRAILDYWSQFERFRLTAAAPDPVSRPR